MSAGSRCSPTRKGRCSRSFSTCQESKNSGKAALGDPAYHSEGAPPKALLLGRQFRSINGEYALWCVVLRITQVYLPRAPSSCGIEASVVLSRCTTLSCGFIPTILCLMRSEEHTSELQSL